MSILPLEASDFAGFQLSPTDHLEHPGLSQVIYEMEFRAELFLVELYASADADTDSYDPDHVLELAYIPQIARAAIVEKGQVRWTNCNGAEDAVRLWSQDRLSE